MIAQAVFGFAIILLQVSQAVFKRVYVQTKLDVKKENL